MNYTIAITPNLRKSAYFDATVAAGVQSFSIYNHMLIPGHFGDPDGEYDKLINGVVQWDVAAQRQVEINGPDASKLVQYLTPRDISNAKSGQGKYVPICDYDGTLINDPVLLKLSETQYWLSIADSDIALWTKSIAVERGYDVSVFEPDVSPLAIQGPKAVDLVIDLFGPWVRDLKYFWFSEVTLQDIPLVLARSGWSKQGGFELYLRDKSMGTKLWNIVARAGKKYDIGPGAPNDTERVESGLLSYGCDARQQTHPVNPFEVGLGTLVDLQGIDDFIGKQALQKIKEAGILRRIVGLFVDGPKVSGNQHQLPIMLQGDQVGLLTEMVYSPRLNRNIAIGIIENSIDNAQENLELTTDTIKRALKITDLPFCS